MKNALPCFSALCLVCFNLARSAPAPPTGAATGFQLTIDLRDGTRLAGKNRVTPFA